MRTTISELKALAPGTQVGGFPLLIKTARTAFENGGQQVWQEVVFMDWSGEILGHILLPTKKEHDRRTGGYTAWKSKTNLCIMKATVQTTDRGKEGIKLLVTDCFNTATPLTYDQNDELTAEDWQALHDEEIKGKIRHGLVTSWVAANKRLTLTDGEKELIKKLVEFIQHG